MDKLIELDIKEKYLKARNKLILLDYDGTLVNFVPIPETARITIDIYEILYSLIDVPGTRTFIITGRRHTDIEKLLNHIPINIIAEHGAMIRESGLWHKQLEDGFIWKEQITGIASNLTNECPGSHVEEKLYSVAWHYRNCEPDLGFNCSRRLISLILDKFSSKVRILDGKKVVEIISNETGKGIAVKKLFEKKSYDFVLSVGDDATDEEMFEYLLHFPNAVTIKVGEGSTNAKLNFNSINDVLILLRSLLA